MTELTESLYRNVAKLWGVVHRLSVTSRIDQGTFTASLLHFPWKAIMPKALQAVSFDYMEM